MSNYDFHGHLHINFMKKIIFHIMIVSWAFCREKIVTSLEQRIYQKEQERQQLLLFYHGQAAKPCGAGDRQGR